jgi:hypothetical protein
MTYTSCIGGCLNGDGELAAGMSARHALSSGDLVSYGGDARIVATRGEIDRVMAELTGLEAWLRGQVELQDFAIDPVLRVRLALELPPILEKLGSIRDACGHAADAYFVGETDISRELREGTDFSVAQVAAAISSAGPLFGVFGETKVSANLVGVEASIAPPSSIGSLAGRLLAEGEASSTAKGTSNGAQPGWLRIEKFREPASPVSAAQGSVSVSQARYVVYIPGTQSWAPKPGENPFDLTSNFGAISKTGFAGSERAVAAAMKQAGIEPDAKVLLVGHSQGGIIAANISTRFAGSKVLTFGAPLGQLGAALTAPTLSVEHQGDPVPGLDAKPNPLAKNWVTVRQDFKGKDLIAQHQMKGYLQTAIDIDSQATDQGLARLRQEISDFAGTSSTTGQAYFFELSREP